MFMRALPIYLVFLLMGVADAMGPLSSQVSSRPAMAALMPFFVFIAFAVFSVPGGVLAARMGKKNLLLLGLGLCAAATSVPAFMEPPFALLLACIFLLGVGTTFLQVAGNPIMRDVCAQGAYSRNLSLAQGIKGLGSTASAYLVTAAASIAFLAAMDWRGAFPIFFALMALAFVAVAVLRVDEAKPDVPPSVASCLALLKMPTFALAVLGIFLYVGAEVCMATFLKPALLSAGFEEKSAALLGPSLFFAALTVGRLAAGAIKASPRTLFRISAGLGLGGLALLAGASALGGHAAVIVAAVAISALGFANIWPMLFSITVEQKPERASELSGLMCMAISGGALVPLLMGALGGGANAAAFAVPIACFAFILALAAKKQGELST
jgi:fucose permease